MLRAAPLIKSFGELHLRHQRSFEFAIEALLSMERDMGTPEILECLWTSGIVLDAASNGNIEIVSSCLEHYPELMWKKDFTEKLIKEIVNRRHVDLFRLVSAFKTVPCLIDDMWIMEALVESQPGYAATDVSGAAFLMQRELQWLKVGSPYLSATLFYS